MWGGKFVVVGLLDGWAICMAMFWGFKNIGMNDGNARGTNMLDTGAHFYDVYKCSDDKFVSIGSIEPQFYAQLLQLTGLASDAEFANQQDRTIWPKLKQRLTDVFATKSQAQWCQIMEGTDVCFAPVLTMSEAARHPHNVARQTFIEVDGVVQPAPAPRFSRTDATVSHGPVAAGENTREVLQSWGINNVDDLITRGVLKQNSGGK